MIYWVFFFSFIAIALQLSCVYISYHLNGRLGRFMLIAFSVMVIRRITDTALLFQSHGDHVAGDHLTLLGVLDKGVLTAAISALLFFGLRSFDSNYGHLKREVMRLQHGTAAEVRKFKVKHEVDTAPVMSELEESQREIKLCIRRSSSSNFRHPVT